MKSIINSFDRPDWCMVALIILLLMQAAWLAYAHEAPALLPGAGIGIVIGALTMGLAFSIREHKYGR